MNWIGISDWHQILRPGGTHLHNLCWLTGTAASFLGMGLLRWRRKKQTEKFSAKQKSLALPVPTYQHALPYMTFELTRARRYGHSLTVLVLGLDLEPYRETSERLEPARHMWSNERVAKKFYYSLIGAVLQEGMRDSDIVSYDLHADQFVIMLTDTGEEQARHTVMRLSELVHKHAQSRLQVGLAEFPAHGFTMSELLKNAQKRYLQQSADNWKLSTLKNEPGKADPPQTGANNNRTGRSQEAARKHE